MTDRNKVVWSEGLFLRTQHFQQQDRHSEWLARRALRATPLQGFGFVELKLDPTALDAGMVGIEQAEGVFPDGTFFSIPAETTEVAPVPVTASTEGGPVSLAIPAERAGAALVDSSHAAPSGTRYRGELVTVRDEIRNGAEETEIEVARLAPRLILPGEETTGYTVLPIAQISGLNSEGGVVRSESFLPPALMISAVPWYAQFLKELLIGVDHVCEAHAGMVVGGTGASMENLLILEAANAARPRLAHLAQQNNVHPSELFLNLAGLAGQLATYGASARRFAELPAYDHGTPGPAFQTLADELRSLILSLSHVEPKSRSLPVNRHSENIWTVRIDNPDILTRNRIVLRVGGRMSEAMLRKLFAKQTTVGAPDEFDALWKSKLPGIPLKPLHSQPREIPYDGDRLCLELDRSSEHWVALSSAKGFVIGVAGKLDPEPEIDCYAVSR